MIAEASGVRDGDLNRLAVIGKRQPNAVPRLIPHPPRIPGDLVAHQAQKRRHIGRRNEDLDGAAHGPGPVGHGRDVARHLIRHAGLAQQGGNPPKGGSGRLGAGVGH